MSILEVYNESLRDLLSKDHTKKLEIRGGAGGSHVPDAETVAGNEMFLITDINAIYIYIHIQIKH